MRGDAGRRLDQDAQSWLTAKGFAPTTLFQPTPREMEGEHMAPPPARRSTSRWRPVRSISASFRDLSVRHQRHGTLQANFKVTGSGYDPHLDGAIDIKGVVSRSGSRHVLLGLDTRIDLKPDLVTISEFRILDKNKQPMTIGGSLAVHERSVGASTSRCSPTTSRSQQTRPPISSSIPTCSSRTVPRAEVEGSVEVGPGP
jgi:hypothetical protein